MISAAIQSPELARLAVLAGHMGDTLPDDGFGAAQDNVPWAAEFAGPAWGDLGRGYIEVAERAGYVHANRQLHDHSPLIRDDLYLAADDDAIRAFCDRRVTECQKKLAAALLNGANNPVPLRDPVVVGLVACAAVLDRYQLEWPAPASPIAGPSYDLQPLANRLTCARWWRRLVRVEQARAVGQLARKRRQVAKYRQAYVDDWNVQRCREAAIRNHETLSQTVATNEDGQEYTLAELAAVGVSNLKNRRHELMTRVRGFEEVADSLGHSGEFWTFTTASKWHCMRWLKKPGKAVPVANWNESTPRQAQQWLGKLWARIRADLDRAGIRIYGFRVVEPHHDGTPHWHLLVFLHPDDRRMARKLCRRHLLSDDGQEKGAWRYRFDAKRIDPGKGTASGYIAKYIAKNIDGAGLNLQDDDSGLGMAEGAERVRAWASTWGIRQFQQIGGPSVTVWRELRRLCSESEPGLQSDLFGNEAAMGAALAADCGDWAAYVECMGGPMLPRKCRPAAPGYWVEAGPNGEARELTSYGDVAKGAVFGLWVRHPGRPDEPGACLTRQHRWQIEHRRPAEPEIRGNRSDADLVGDRGVPDWVTKLAGIFAGQGQGIAARWSCPFSGAAALDLCQ
jgi:hypothetical protein